MNPYDNNPFENNEKRELKNERDANRAMANTRDQLSKGIGDIFAPLKKDELGFWENAK